MIDNSEMTEYEIHEEDPTDQINFHPEIIYNSEPEQEKFNNHIFIRESNKCVISPEEIIQNQSEAISSCKTSQKTSLNNFNNLKEIPKKDPSNLNPLCNNMSKMISEKFDSEKNLSLDLNKLDSKQIVELLTGKSDFLITSQGNGYHSLNTSQINFFTFPCKKLPTTSEKSKGDSIQGNYKKNISIINSKKGNGNNGMSNLSMFNNSISCGERMYQKALAYKEKKEKKIKEIKTKKEEQEKKHCSFRPKLNDESCVMSIRVKLLIKNIIYVE
jgi:hypothetical protein